MVTEADKNFPACNDPVDLRSHRIITFKLEEGNRNSRERGVNDACAETLLYINIAAALLQ